MRLPNQILWLAWGGALLGVLAGMVITVVGIATDHAAWVFRGAGWMIGATGVVIVLGWIEPAGEA